MTTLEIQDKRKQLVDQNDSIFEKAKAENRSVADQENLTIQGNLLQLQELEMREANELFKSGQSGKMIGKGNNHVGEPREKFSLFDAINAEVEKRNQKDISRNVFTLGRQSFLKSGVNPVGTILLPSEIRADILAQTSSQGQEIVAEDKKGIIPPLASTLIFSQAGATYLLNCVGDVSIPSYAGTTVAWKTEVQAAADGGGAFSEVNFSPKRLTAYLQVSKTFLAQDAVGAEALLLSNIADAVRRKLEGTILGVAAGVSTTQPQGMGYKCTTGADTKANAAVPTWLTVVGLETTVDTSNAAVGNLAYISNAGGRGALKSIQKVATYGSEMLCEDNMVNGYPLLVTNSASAVAGDDDIGDLLIFGNWKDLCICQWGGYDITVDPYTLAATNQVKIVINAYFDAKGLRGTAATDVHGVTQADDYAISFASMAIKAS